MNWNWKNGKMKIDLSPSKEEKIKEELKSKWIFNQPHDFLLECSLGDQPIHIDNLLLSDTVSPVHGLGKNSTIIKRQSQNNGPKKWPNFIDLHSTPRILGVRGDYSYTQTRWLPYMLTDSTFISAIWTSVLEIFKNKFHFEKWWVPGNPAHPL